MSSVRRIVARPQLGQRVARPDPQPAVDGGPSSLRCFGDVGDFLRSAIRSARSASADASSLAMRRFVGESSGVRPISVRSPLNGLRGSCGRFQISE